MTARVSTALSRLVVDGLRPLIDTRLAASRRPFDGRPEPRPHVESSRWAWTHYGAFVPLLPEPLRYLNTMTMIGSTGTEILDDDELVVGDARRTATVLSSTARGEHHHHRAYGAEECDFAADGSALAWGDDLRMAIDLPVVRVEGRYDAFEVDLELTATDQVSYFVRTPAYQHYSLLAPFTGTVRDRDGATEVSGLGTFEYARAMSHQALMRRAVPAWLKLPADFFAYNIIQLDDRTQLLLSNVEARGRSACRLVHVRTVGGAAEAYDDVTFSITRQGPPGVDPSGRPTRPPASFRWRARAPSGVTVLELDCTVDAPLRFGHGRGHAGAFSYTGTFRERPVSGSGYLEWVDVRR